MSINYYKLEGMAHTQHVKYVYGHDTVKRKIRCIYCSIHKLYRCVGCGTWKDSKGFKPWVSTKKRKKLTEEETFLEML